MGDLAMDYPDLLDGTNLTYEQYLELIQAGNSREDVHWFGPDLEIPLILVYVLIMTFGLLANGIICYVVLRNKTLRTVRNMFIVNLAVSDMLMCLFCVPFTVFKLLIKTWPLGEPLCQLVPFLQGVNVFGSTITITAIALDRYQVILYPWAVNERYRKYSAAAFVSLIWISSVIIGLPLLIYSKVVDQRYIRFVSFSICVEEWPSGASRFAYAAVVMVLQFLVPIVVLLSVHWRISNFLKCRILRNPATPMEMNRAMREAKRHRKNSALLMAIAIMYALCWFPLTLLNFLADFDYTLFSTQNFLIAFAVAHIVAMTSAVVNPILYGWFNSNFRKEFNSIVCFWRVRDSGDFVADENQKLVRPPAQCIVFPKRMSYKAIQTEVQPVYREPTASIASNGTEETTGEFRHFYSD